MNVHQHNFHAYARRDPTKTTVVRRRFERDLVRRFRELQKKIRKAIVEENAFGLTANVRFDFPTSAGKVNAFMRWLRDQEKAGIFEVTRGVSTEAAAQRAWQNVYIRSAYQKGLASAASQMRKGGVEVSDRWIDTGFYRPIHAEAAGLIFIRVFSELEGITSAMDRRISRSLADSLVKGYGMMEIADELIEAVGAVGIARARVLARTETIRAHAEATLNTYEEAQIEGVEVESEFTTAGDDSVCPQCEELEGQVYSIEDARGVIPVHPNCRCAWLPVVRDPQTRALL